ncbi:MAG: PD-(D/E)XK nuclease family protein [Gammaproteobacteria bacterium]|nr:PD-(D/E)XK nuclease family protein [Gammaproteobacteria bacterium]MDH5653838.1 PD-(D/E)XK nuclease family protein [Gammaproteobacteria bacterium]
MRNIFDQYSQPENKLTHALVTALHEDRKLLGKFVRWVTGMAPPAKSINIVEQRLPGDPESNETDYSRQGLPDAWIYSDDDWSLIIENKVSATLTRDQLNRHLATANRRGFTKVTLLVVDVAEPKFKLPKGSIFKSWPDIYEWLYKQSGWSYWAGKVCEYMDVAESKWPDDNYLKEGTLTKFSGIPFDNDNPYSYLEAKRLIKLIMAELRSHTALNKQLGMDPVAPGRGMITGKNASLVWDCLRLKAFDHEKDFVKTVHLTVGIQSERVVAIIIVPNSIKRSLRNRLFQDGYEGFEELFRQVHRNINKTVGKVKGVESYVDVLQRHYRTQKSQPTVDARQTFSLDTAFPSKNSDVKHQPIWLESAYELLANKKGNTQLGVGAVFSYANCPSVKSPKIVESIANTWLACKPLIDVILDKQK